MPERKPVSEMTGAEVGAVLRPLSRETLEDMLVFLSGLAPEAVERALARAERGEQS